jgi:secretion/DNA translocation related TadE-like protein
MTAKDDRRRVERGYATVWAVGWLTCCLCIAWLIWLLTAAVARQHHLDGAADLTALSAAAARQQGEGACEAAARVAQASQVELVDCTSDGMVVTVQVTDRFTLPIGSSVHLTSSSRAGPATE